MAYVQGKGETVDSSALALHLKTSMVDLTSAYKGVQAALQSYEDAGAASRQAATAYAMETGSKTEWFSALSAKEDARAALVSAIAGFSRQANSLNEDSGGWVSRSCGWFADEFTQLFQQESEDDKKTEETPKPLEDHPEEGSTEEPGTEEGKQPEEQPAEGTTEGTEAAGETPETEGTLADPEADETGGQTEDRGEREETPEDTTEEGT